jgi:hypothetical protein
MLFEMPEVKFPERSYRELRVAGTGSEPPLGLSTSHGNPEMTPAKCACEVGFSVSSLAEGLRPSKLPKIPFQGKFGVEYGTRPTMVQGQQNDPRS